MSRVCIILCKLDCVYHHLVFLFQPTVTRIKIAVKMFTELFWIVKNGYMRCADWSNGMGLYMCCVSNHPPRQVHVAYLVNLISCWQSAVSFLTIGVFFPPRASQSVWMEAIGSFRTLEEVWALTLVGVLSVMGRFPMWNWQYARCVLP
mgnify:CR=1 FL=1